MFCFSAAGTRRRNLEVPLNVCECVNVVFVGITHISLYSYLAWNVTFYM